MESKCAKGSLYDKLLEDFIKLDGDLKECPFNTDNYKYNGPILKDNEILKSSKYE